MLKFLAGLNHKIVGKCEPQKLSYAGAFKPQRLDMAGLAKHIGQGHPWMPAILSGDRRRKQTNANQADVLGLDIDDGLTIPQALQHPFIRAHCGLLIESSSSKPEHHKFRLVFRLAEQVKGWQNIRLLNRWLAEQVGSADPACKDASRFFFGGKDRQPHLLSEGATLPQDALQQARSWDDAIQAKARAEAEQRRQQWASMPREQSGDLVRDALACIAPYRQGEGRYDSLITMMGGVLNDLGSEGEQLLLEWDAGRGEWGTPFDRKLAGLARTPGNATLGSLFYLAKTEGGFQRPKTSRSFAVRQRQRAKAKAETSDGAPSAAIAVARALGLPASDGDQALDSLRSHYQPGQVSHDRTIDNSQPELGDGDRRWLQDGASIKLLDGNTGDGKTYVVGQAIPAYAKALDIASTCNLAGGLGQRHGLNPVSSRHGEGNMDRAAIPAESLHRSIGTDYDALFIDEIDVVLRRIIEGSLGRDRQDSNLRQLKRLLAQTAIALSAQAQPSPVTVELLRYLSGRDVEVARVERPQATAATVTAYEYPDRDTLLASAIEAQRQGQRILMIWGGVDAHRSILRELRRVTPKGSNAPVGRDGRYTLPGVITHFGLDPNGDLQRFGSASITRVAETGADIQGRYDRVFFIPSPSQDSEQCWQHISRARGLLNGTIERLDYALPDKSFVSVEHLNPAYHADKRRQRNAYYLGLLEQGKSNDSSVAGIKERLAELETLFGYLARYEAESAARVFFRDEYLKDRFASLGWIIRSPEPVDLAKLRPDSIPDLLDGGKRKIAIATAYTIARGHRDIADYSPNRQEQIEDDRQQGFVLSGYRRKLALARTLPQSPLEDQSWVLEWIVSRELAEPQARFRALLLLAQQPEVRAMLDQFRQQRQGAAIEHGRQHGPLALLAKLSKGKDLPLLAVVNDFADDDLIQDILSDRNAEWHRYQDRAIALASKIRANVDRLRALSLEVLEKHLDWAESDPCSLINKFLKQCLGLGSTQLGQRRIDGKRPRVYGLECCDRNLERLADDKRQAAAELWHQLGALTTSAGEGWLKALQCAGLGGVTLNLQAENTARLFSVTPLSAPPPTAVEPPPPTAAEPPPSPPTWRYIGQKYAALYGGVPLIPHQRSQGMACYALPDGRLTTWLHPEDVAIAA